MNTLKLTVIFTINIFLINLSNTLAQELLFQEIESEMESLDVEMKEKLEKLKNNPYFSRVTRIKIPKLKTLKKEGELSFKIPNHKFKLTAYVDYVSYDEETNDFEWMGDIVDKAYNSVGHLILHQSYDELYGELQILDEYYTLESLGKDKNGRPFLYLLSHDQEMLEGSICGVDESTHNNNTDQNEDASQGIAKNNSSCSSAKIKVLVVYTQAVQNSGINPLHKANASINLLNQAMANSNFSSYDLEFKLAKVVRSTKFNEIGKLNHDLFQSNVNEYLREEHEADLMITYVYYPIIEPGGQGVAFVNDDATIDRDKRGIVRISSENQTFAHEVIHLLGGRHQSDPDTYTARAYGSESCTTNSGSTFHTLMWGNNRDGFRRNFVSDPNKSFQNCQAGSATRNVFSRIDQNRCAVSQFFYHDTFTPSLQISGSYYYYYYKNISSNIYEAIVHDHDGKINSYLWQISYNGFDYESVSKRKIVTLKDIDIKRRKFFLKANVVLEDGKTISEILAIKIKKNGKSFEQVKTIVDSKNNTFQRTLINPNPVSNNFIITATEDQEKLQSIQLIDLKGSIIKSIDGIGNNSISVSVNQIPPGSYIVRVYLDHDMETHKIIIQK